MLIIGCDYHPSVQQIAFVNAETGESGERRLLHKDGEAERFYRDLKLRGVSVRLGIEATGHARWFERLLAELGFELWIGNPYSDCSLAKTNSIIHTTILSGTSRKPRPPPGSDHIAHDHDPRSWRRHRQ